MNYDIIVWMMMMRMNYSVGATDDGRTVPARPPARLGQAGEDDVAAGCWIRRGETVGNSDESSVSRVHETRDSVVARNGPSTDDGESTAKEKVQVPKAKNSYADAVKLGLTNDVGESDDVVALTTLK
jgi:hypothetical protein